MSFTEAQLSSWLAAFLWPLIRIGALITAAPILNSRQFPNRLRLGLALILTWIVIPTLPAPPVVNVFSHDALMIMLQQLLIGVSMGFLLQMVFAALVFGGQVMAYSMGLGFASMVDPQNGTQVPVLSQYYVILATLLFLLLNGHLILIELVVDSFQTLPIAVEGLAQSNFRELVAWGSRMFVGGLLISLPIMAALLLTNLGMGIVMRAAPQLNIFAVGFPVTILLGFLMMWVTLPNVMDIFSNLLKESFQIIKDMLLIVR